MTDYHTIFREIKEELGYTNKDISLVTGLTEGTINTQTQPNKDFPRWLKMMVDVWLRMKKDDSSTM